MPACTPTHKVSSLVQGPGVCCAALTSSGVTAVSVGTRVAATDKNGKCFICEVKALRKGGLGFKRGKSFQAGSPANCPTQRQGCCQLAGL
jgi:hypothetical protein